MANLKDFAKAQHAELSHEITEGGENIRYQDQDDVKNDEEEWDIVVSFSVWVNANSYAWPELCSENRRC